MNTSVLETRTEDARRLVLPDLATVAEPFHLRYEHPYRQKLVVEAGRSTRALIVIEELAAPGAEGESALEADFTLAPGACVKVVYLTRGGESIRRFLKSRYFLESHADIDTFSFVNEGALTAREQTVEFRGAHGFASFKGLSVLHGRSAVQDRIIADHKVGECTSRQFFKNILAGSARSEFHSLVSVSPGASKSDSRQLNKNLLLSDNARAESRPELRIDTDDVQASHGAATGQVDKDELFYLRSRGLSEPLARYVMTLGFAEEMLEDLEPAALKNEIRAAVKAEIKEALGSEDIG